MTLGRCVNAYDGNDRMRARSMVRDSGERTPEELVKEGEGSGGSRFGEISELCEVVLLCVRDVGPLALALEESVDLGGTRSIAYNILPITSSLSSAVAKSNDIG